MWEIIKIIVTAIVAGLILEHYFYSPNAQIKRLRKEILELTSKIIWLKKEPPNISDVTTPIIYEYEKKIQKKKKLINELIDYYFDSEEDQDSGFAD